MRLHSPVSRVWRGIRHLLRPDQTRPSIILGFTRQTRCRHGLNLSPTPSSKSRRVGLPTFETFLLPKPGSSVLPFPQSLYPQQAWSLPPPSYITAFMPSLIELTRHANLAFSQSCHPFHPTYRLFCYMKTTSGPINSYNSRSNTISIDTRRKPPQLAPCRLSVVRAHSIEEGMALMVCPRRLPARNTQRPSRSETAV